MKKLTVLTFGLMAFLLAPCFELSAQMPFPQRRAAQAGDLYQDAAAALRARRLTEARAKLQKIITDYPQDFYAGVARRMLIDILRDLNEHEQAISMLKEILADQKTSENHLWARENLCNLLYELQRFREGIELLEGWRKASPNDVWVERQLARFYLQTGRKDEAWMILEAILERNADAATFRDLLDLALKSDEIDKLLKTLEDRRTRFRSRDYSDFVSDCYLALGKKEKAIEVIKATPELQREWLLLEKLADLQIDTGKIAEALKTLEQIDQITPDNWNTLKKLGHCLFLLKRRDEAIQVWRRPLLRPHFQGQDQYLNFTTTLIEHQLYEEALQGFAEARQKMNSPTLFAEEVATVLEALGRKTEALEEYIQVFANGAFRIEVFNRLYESDSPAFNLEQRLTRLLRESYSIAVRQALIEYYFRRQNQKSIEGIVKLVVASAGVLDDFVFSRLNQEAAVFAANFHFDLCRNLIRARPDSTLGLRLAVLMLRMARLEAILGDVAFNEALALGRSKETADADLKAELLLELADFAFTVKADAKTACELLDLILQSVLLKAAPTRAVAAAIARAHIMICEEDYQQAQSLLAENHKNVSAARENIFAADPIGESDYLAHILLEQAFLALNQHDFQKALDMLKNIVEELPETIWANDALEMAMLVTRTSIGDFSLLKNLLRARRLAATGRSADAEKQYAEIITANASLTVLIEEIEGEMILRAGKHLDDEQLLNKITKFIQARPDHFVSADLLEKKLFLLRKKKTSADEIRELMQMFIDNFPDDLRSGRFKKLIEQNRLLVLPPEKSLKIIPGLEAEQTEIPKLPIFEDGGDVDLDQLVPQEEMLDLDETGDY